MENSDNIFVCDTEENETEMIFYNISRRAHFLRQFWAKRDW